jgi:hypothetical protein
MALRKLRLQIQATWHISMKTKQGISIVQHHLETSNSAQSLEPAKRTERNSRERHNITSTLDAVHGIFSYATSQLLHA